MTSPVSLFSEMTAELLDRGNQVRFRAEGGSMSPTIRSGEVVIVEPLPPAGLKAGDICLYRAPRGLLAHRLVRIEGTVFIMRGDPLRFPEEEVAHQQILGKVVAAERKGRRISLIGWRAALKRRIYAVTSWIRHSGPTTALPY